MDSPAAEILAAHFAPLTFGDIPDAEVAKVKTLLLDYLGVAIAGSRTESGEIARGFAVEYAGTPVSSLIGAGEKVTAPEAAFANAICAHSIEMDDVDVLALFHFSPPVVSACLAAAERVRAGGREFLAALVSGCEVMARASNATNFSLRNRGFHTTPVCGVFGAAVAAGKVARLSVGQMVSALGLAGAQASGLMEMYGPSMQKRFNPGPAARNGVTAAMMAELGFTGAATIFEGRYGFCQAYSDEHDPSALTRDIGSTYNLDIEYKAYSCARPIHNAIDCAINVRKQMSAQVDGIQYMIMRRHPDWADYHLNAAPQTYHEAQVSLPFSVAVALVEGQALPDQYGPVRLHDPKINRLATMLNVVPDADLPRGVSCHLQVTTADGETFESQVDHPRGSIGNPMSEAAMHEKFHMLADPVIGHGQAQRLVELVGNLDAGSVADLMALTSPSAQGKQDR